MKSMNREEIRDGDDCNKELWLLAMILR